MSLCRLLLLATTVAACAGNDPPPPPEVDAPTGLPACTMATFDPCTDNGDCTSNNCHFFMQSNFSVCVSACTPGNNSTCPVDSTGANGTCNNMGICKPLAPNECAP